jgi:olefin beta-lactone synthetase
VTTLDLRGPVVTVGHDWGGPVSLGWATRHPDRLAGVVLLNTAVHHPAGRPIPALLRLAGARGVLAAATTRTPAFLDTTLGLADPRLEPAVRAAYRAPYATPDRRRGIGQFVADIPATPAHVSTPELTRIAEALPALDVPALLLRGPRDPVFGEVHLDDLARRLGRADVHRFEGAGHLLAEERPYAEAILDWLDDRVLAGTHPTAPPAQAHPAAPPIWQNLLARRGDAGTAIIDLSGRRTTRVDWRTLAMRVEQLAAGLHALGVGPGDRVSLLLAPGPTLTAVLYACLRIGAVVVVADRGLGLSGLSRAVRGAVPRVVIGERAGLAAARALGWPGLRISAQRLSPTVARALGVAHSLGDVVRAGRDAPSPAEPAPDDHAAILFTSGSTGPAKGVVYTHGQLAALRDALAEHFAIDADTGLVTGFAPFALLGPALGTRSATPAMDVSAPRTLTATAVARAVADADARIVFLSPAALDNVVRTAGELGAADRAALARVRTFLCTGAPVGAEGLRAAAELMPNATAHTPYGMTECLLVTDITLGEREEAAASGGSGLCVGAPLAAAEVRISALDAHGAASGTPATQPGVTGEIVVSAPHLKRGYHRLWLTDRASVRALVTEPGRWHRTGDVGHLDARGRLWIEGRLPHVVTSATGPITPVGPEQEVEAVADVRRAALVGVGPAGAQVCVAVVESRSMRRPRVLAPEALAADVRAAASVPLAAVLVVPRLPTDIRHNSKIDRTRVAVWAERVLAGERGPRL